MNAQTILPVAALAVLGVLAETMVLKGQTATAMQIATGVIGALNLAGAVAARIRAPGVSADIKEPGA